MHSLETLIRINDEWPHPLTHTERKVRRRESAIEHLENRLGTAIDRADPMLDAMAGLELALLELARKHGAG